MFESLTISYSGFCTCQQLSQVMTCLFCHFRRLLCPNAEFARLQTSWSLLLLSTGVCEPELFFVSAADFICFDSIFFAYQIGLCNCMRRDGFPDVVEFQI